MSPKFVPLFAIPLILAPIALAQTAPPAANYDEAKVPKYTLPDPLKFENGTPVKGSADWPKRRAEILGLFETHVYGRTPDIAKNAKLTAEVTKTIPDFLGGDSGFRGGTFHYAPAAEAQRSRHRDPAPPPPAAESTKPAKPVISMRNAIIHGEIVIPIVIIPLIFPSRLFFFRGRAPQTI